MGKACLNEEAVSDYLEDRLSQDQRTEVEKHLSDCEKRPGVISEIYTAKYRIFFVWGPG